MLEKDAEYQNSEGSVGSDFFLRIAFPQLVPLLLP